jgi:hypothetical protein
LHKYREHGVTQQSQLIPFEQMRFRRELRLKRVGKLKNGNSGSSTPTLAASARFLPQAGDYSVKAILDPHYEEKSVLQPLQMNKNKKRPKKSLWSRKKEKTGRRLLLHKHSCIITFANSKSENSEDSS